MDISMGFLLKTAIDFDNHCITKTEAKTQLDTVKEIFKRTHKPQEHQTFSDFIEFLKIGVDSRTDVPRDSVFVPYNVCGRICFIKQYIW